MAAEDKADETLSIEQQPAASSRHRARRLAGARREGRMSTPERAWVARSNYQYGILLKPGVTGKLAQGIGMGAIRRHDLF